ncbi:hypothetical protein [Sphingobium tyrosinilyticum]|uniref:C-type lysozyme inhibitor domain-containing protein n=1 Tax=Sphingobium tyrosinilyticum TaxID=2715436 RepID=A0ABV9F022_9SPHN
MQQTKPNLRKALRAFIAFVIFVVTCPAAAASAASDHCMRAGEPTKPLVNKAETAAAIFLAVEGDFFPTADRIFYPDIDVEDDGARWSVSRGKSPEVNAEGDVAVTHGGGQLALSIAKCDGRISDVWFDK